MAKKKKYIVLARNGKIQDKGLVTGKGHRTFGKHSAMWISDPAEAREIETTYGMKGSKQVSVTTDQQYEWSVNNEGSNGTKMDNIHHYTFQGVDTSHFVKPQEGDTKVIGGTEYEYVKVGEKLILTPIYELPQKRNKRRVIAEVQNGVQ